MRYIDAQEVIDNVMNELDNIFNTNSTLLDDTILFPVIKRCMAKLRHNHLPMKWCVIRVDNNVGELPEDFYKACSMILCKSEEVCCHGRYSECIHTEEQKVCSTSKCEDTCQYEKQCGDMYRVIEKRMGGYLSRINRYALLCPSKSSYPSCTDDCFNFKSKSPYEVDIQDNKIKTNFNKGLIHIDYLATLDDKIPDNERIIEWVEKELIYKVFQILYYNGEGDYVRRYQEAKFNVDIAYRNAINIIKTPEVNEYYQLARNMQKRYNSCNLWNGTYLEPGNKRSNPSLQRYTR